MKTSGLEEEDSLAENTDREALHPLDQFRAFAALAEKGQGIEDIAASFSVTPAVVRQRLKLASVSPKLLALYEEDALTLDLLMAFALNADHARQEQVWEAIQQRSWLQTPHHIRRLLTENTVSARHASVRFVGIEAYEAAGGFVMRDLFEEDGGGYLTDPLLLQKLVNEKLDAAAETVRAEGWKWVEAAEDIPYNATYGLRPLVPVAPALTDEEEHELETLLNERDELEASEGDAETEKRLSAVTQRITELEAKTPTFAPEDVASAGCFVSLDSDGRLCIERGYVRPEDEPRSSEDAEAAEPLESASGGEQETDWRPVPSAAPVEDRDDDSAALPEKLIADLTTFRTLALRDALANDPDTALLALLHTLSLKLLYSYGAHMTCVEIQAHGLLPNTLKDARQTKPAKAIEARTNGWKQALPREATRSLGFSGEPGPGRPAGSVGPARQHDRERGDRAAQSRPRPHPPCRPARRYAEPRSRRGRLRADRRKLFRPRDQGRNPERRHRRPGRRDRKPPCRSQEKGDGDRSRAPRCRNRLAAGAFARRPAEAKRR